VIRSRSSRRRGGRGASSIDLQASLGSAPGLRPLRVGTSDANVPLLGPWTVTVTFSTGPTKTTEVVPDADGKGTLLLTMQEAQDAQNVEIRDVAGNGGTLAVP
jgi:neutral ceramidase